MDESGFVSSLPKRLRAPKDTDLASLMAFSCFHPKKEGSCHEAYICFLFSECLVPVPDLSVG